MKTSQPLRYAHLSAPTNDVACVHHVLLTAATKASRDTLPWVEKYRPTALDDLISHTAIIATLNKLIAVNKLPHLLLFGPPGTGKTSTILAIARQLNGPNFNSMVLELNASDDRGIDVVREQIKDFASSRQLFSAGLKMIILDEADQMTKTAQFALRRIIEKYTKSTRFCLIANYVNRIIPALQSRCTRFRFSPLQADQIRQRLMFVCNAEKVNIDQSGIDAVIRLSEGDMRKCLNVLQAAHLAFASVNEINVYACTGNPLPSDIRSILTVLLNAPLPNAYKHIQEMQTEKGLSLVDIVGYLHEQLMLMTSMPPRALIYVMEKLADAEYRLSVGSSEKLQLAAVVGIFANTRMLLVADGNKELEAREH